MSLISEINPFSFRSPNELLFVKDFCVSLRERERERKKERERGRERERERERERNRAPKRIWLRYIFHIIS